MLPLSAFYLGPPPASRIGVPAGVRGRRHASSPLSHRCFVGKTRSPASSFAVRPLETTRRVKASPLWRFGQLPLAMIRNVSHWEAMSHVKHLTQETLTAARTIQFSLRLGQIIERTLCPPVCDCVCCELSPAGGGAGGRARIVSP